MFFLNRMKSKALDFMVILKPDEYAEKVLEWAHNLSLNGRVIIIMIIMII